MALVQYEEEEEESSSANTIEQIEYEKGQREARWAGDDPLARIATSLVSIKPLYNALKFCAQKVIIRTAEESGVPWQKMVKDLKESDVYAEKELLENVNISYPDCISARYLRDRFPVAQVTGLDLSPYYLAGAQHFQKQEAVESSPAKRNIQYVHANGEETGLPSQSFDIISYAFLCHELPQYVTSRILREARRLIKPGGTIALLDISPEFKVIQDLHPALFTMMKATEPWLDEYFALDLKAELERNGFTNITSSLTSPRDATITATAI